MRMTFVTVILVLLAGSVVQAGTLTPGLAAHMETLRWETLEDEGNILQGN
jgi:hypothetical protein